MTNPPDDQSSDHARLIRSLRDSEDAGRADGEQIKAQHIRKDMGVAYEKLADTTSLKKRVYDFMYHPVTEVVIFLLIIVSVALLAIEVSLPDGGTGGWMGGLTSGEMTGWFFAVDLAFTVVFAIEYGIKLWIAPRRWEFVKRNWIDLLALLPILRVLRFGRAVRLLRMFRLLRLARVGQLLTQVTDSFATDVSKNRGDSLVIGLYMAFSVVFGSVGILVFEQGVNPDFNTLADGLWWCIVTLTTVGYGDVYPQTGGGKIVAGVLMFIGLSFYALLTGFLSSALIERAKRNAGHGMELLTMENHVIICGWNPHARTLLKDLRRVNPSRDLVFVTRREEIPAMFDRHVHHLQADPTTAEALEKARLEAADVVVVLSDVDEGRSEYDADARSVLIALAVERHRPDVHIIVELNDEENVFHVENAGVDEVIVSQRYTGTMLSQSVQNPGLSATFRDLFEAGSGAYFTQEEIGEQLAGETFGDVARAWTDACEGILVGYRSKAADRVTLAPDDETVLQQGDIAIALQSTVE